MRVLVITPPDPVVTLAEARDHLRIDGGDEDALIEAFVASATAHLDGPDGILGRAIGVQTLEARFDTYETCGPLRLPLPPIVDLVSTSWLGADRAEHIGDLADVEIVGEFLQPIDQAPWEGLFVGREALRVRYRAGYATIPPAIRSAILLMTSFLFHHRGAAPAEAPSAIGVLLRPYMVFR